jgi:hypothetical protein
MLAADEFQLIRPDLAFWQLRPAVKAISQSARWVGSQLVFIDPIPLAAPALEELAALATPAAIVLTNGNHARAAAKFRAQFSIPIFAHADAVAEMDIPIDGALEDGAMVADALAWRVPGRGARGGRVCGGGAHTGCAHP